MWGLLYCPVNLVAPAGNATWQAGRVRCIHLTDDNHCRIWGHPSYPKVCQQFQASREMCGTSSAEALAILARLEPETAPGV